MADFDIEAKVNYGNIKNLVQAMSKQINVKVGLLANKPGLGGFKGSDELTKDLDIAGNGAVQEFGCDIEITDKMRKFLHAKAKELGLPKLEKKGDGYIHIPARSWLQMPLQHNNGQDLRNKITKNLKTYSGHSKKDAIEYIVKSGDFASLGVAIGAAAQEQIIEAFATEGWGEWKPNSPYTIAQKGSSMPLVNFGKLNGAVTFEVVNNG